MKPGKLNVENAKLPLGGTRTEAGELAELVQAAEYFIRKEEVARRLGCSVRALDEWVQKRVIPHYKILNSLLFKWSEVEASVAKTRRPGPTGK